MKNALEVGEEKILRAMLAQLMYTIKDANSLAWPTVRGAFAWSMHALEVGNLDWADAQTWAQNRALTDYASFSSSGSSNQVHGNVNQFQKKITC